MSQAVTTFQGYGAVEKYDIMLQKLKTLFSSIHLQLVFLLSSYLFFKKEIHKVL